LVTGLLKDNVEIAKNRGVRLTFGEYLKAGPAITLLTLGIGIFWLTIIH
jgi:Na+/H+ antiporter NhaD/arsenite permease-like protein